MLKSRLNSRKSSVKVARLSRVWGTLPTLTFLAVTGLWPERFEGWNPSWKPVNGKLVGSFFAGTWYILILRHLLIDSQNHDLIYKSTKKLEKKSQSLLNEVFDNIVSFHRINSNQMPWIGWQCSLQHLVDWTSFASLQTYWAPATSR